MEQLPDGLPRIHRRPPEVEDEGWLITFADMAVLLMCFFVLLFSVSVPKDDAVKKVAEALKEHGFYQAALLPSEDAFEQLKKQLSLSLGASGYDKLIAPSMDKRGINLELSSAAFFAPGSAKFTPEALPMMKLITDQVMPLAKKDITIEVEGHTDDVPIATAQYPSNWELSAGRAANVVRYLIAQGFPANKLRAVGMADTQPKAPNHDTAGNPIPANQDLNRRVVIRLIKGDDSE